MYERDRPSGVPALVGGGLLNVALGTYYAWSVFVPALEHEFGWSRTQTSLVPTIDMVMLASMFLVAGFLQERIGPRRVAMTGGILFSLGLLLASWIQSLPMLYLTWGLLVGAGLGFGYLAPITVGSKWFPNHRGLVNGLAIAIFAGGSGVFGPLAGMLIERIGWRATFQALAAVFFVFTMVGAYLLKRSAPRVTRAPRVNPPVRRVHALTGLICRHRRCFGTRCFGRSGPRMHLARSPAPWSSASWCPLREQRV